MSQGRLTRQGFLARTAGLSAPCAANGVNARDWSTSVSDEPFAASEILSHVYLTLEETAFIAATGAWPSRITPAQTNQAAIEAIDADCRNTFDKNSFTQFGPDDYGRNLWAA